MIDPLIALTALAIYAGAVIAIYFSGVRVEIWEVRKAKTAFHDSHVKEVTHLQGMAEYDLVTTIYHSENLKGIFSRAPAAGAPATPLTRDDRRKIEVEIKSITAGMKDVDEPRALFKSVCDDFDKRVSTFETLTTYLVLVSLLIPAVVIYLALSPAQYYGAGLIFALVFSIGSMAPLLEAGRAFGATATRLAANQSKLVTAVDEKVHLPAAPEGEIPPAEPPASAGQ